MMGRRHPNDPLGSIPCPVCRYDLRGLTGDHVQCPECGHACDRVAVVTSGWDRPWYEAPGYQRLTTPLAWPVVGGTVLAIWIGIEGPSIPAVLTLGGVVLAWILHLVWFGHTRGRGEDVMLALFAHVVLAAYLGGIVGVVVTIPRTIILGIERRWIELVVWIIFSIVAIIAFAAARAADRYIASRCIRRYLIGVTGIESGQQKEERRQQKVV